MTHIQRRVFAAAIFAFTFILYYEARGRRLLSLYSPEDPLRGAALQVHFWQQIGMGTFVLAFGTVLLIVLRRREQKPDITMGECVSVALGVGLLIGTAIVSWFETR